MKKASEKIEAFLKLGGTKKDITLLVISGISLLLSIFKVFPMLPFDIAWVAIILCGIPILIEAVIGLVTRFDIKADVLVSLALIASVCIGEHFAAGEVAFIMQIGALLEDLTVARARAGIEKLVHLTPQTARILEGETEREIPATEVKVGDILRVLPGESVPVDGIIIKGETSINQAVMTGESLPVDKTVGDEVKSGTVNQFGAFDMRAAKVGEDSSIQRMVRLVQSADAGKAKIVGLADRWATWIVVIALSASILTWIFTGQIIRSVTILVVFCPCALVLATPTAIMASIGNATKHGFLVREGDALERLAKVKKIAFDKTGTLTYGKPEVTAVVSVSPEYSEKDIYRFAASAEHLSEHPLGKAIVSCYMKQNGSESLPDTDTAANEADFLTVTEFSMMPGQGVSAVVSERQVLAGNTKMLDEYGISVSAEHMEISEKYVSGGSTVIFLAIDSVLAGMIVLTDTLRKESKDMIGSLRKFDVEPVLMTGDSENAANAIAGQLDIREVHTDCLPEDKLNHIDHYQENGDMVCMIGDGINDAPALKKALVGIAMGGVGSDIAVDAADIALVDDEVKELPHLMSLSRRMMVVIRRNLAFSMTLNCVAIILAITGILNPVVGALVHNAGSVFVIINSSFLLRWKS
ncbi:MAG: cation-translocating P-type ATPase [Clostridiales bacterium]|nr:cation-translocating P-type ATPase [Clostridiales bacterium]